MKALVFLHGTTIMHRSALGQPREARVQQVRDKEASVRDFAAYVPVGEAVSKLRRWHERGVDITYLSSHKNPADAEKDQNVLHLYGFPAGPVVFRQPGEGYQDVVERVLPDLLIEDDRESIGGSAQTVYPRIRPALQASITSFIIKEFAGVDHLPQDPAALQPQRGADHAR